MKFVQVIEYSTSKADEMRALNEEWRTKTEGKRTASQAMLCQDRDDPNRWMIVVEFPSYEDAMKNSEMPETAEMAGKLAALCDGPPTFRNLDLTETIV